MAASSPYSGNDYNAVSNYRPYELPINDIFKGLSAQNEFWDAGARRVKQIYDTAFNLDLTLDANKEVKRKFMDDADKQLTRLSSMDVSDPSVQRQGFAIYKPLLNDAAINYDSELTKTMKGIYGEAAQYRTKKLSSTGREGEGYTDRNLAYSLDGFENFNSKLARDPEMLKEMYGKLGQRKFTPYYDATKEFSSILKNCKGSGGVKQDVASNYMYFDRASKTGANSSETANCFMMGLSEQAKQQIGIDGWAYYRANPQQLVDDHRNFALGKQEQQVAGIQGVIAALKDGGITAAEQKKIKELEDMLPALQTELKNRTAEYNDMVGGNAMKYITDNFQTLSKGIYLGKSYAQLGEAFKSDVTNHELTANAAGIAQFNAIERSHQQARQNEYDKEQIMLRAQLSRKLKQEAGEIPLDLVNPLNPNVDESTDTQQSYGEKDFLNEKEIAFKAYSDAYQTLGSYIVSKGDSGRAGKSFNSEFLLNYANEHSKKPIEQQDKQFVELMATYNQAKQNYSEMDMRNKAVDALVNDEFKDEVARVADRRVKVNGVELTYQELDAVNKGAKIKGITYTPYNNIVGAKMDAYQDEKDPYKLRHDMVEDRSFNFSTDYYSKFDKKISKRKDELYRKQYYEAKGYVTPRVNTDKVPGLQTQIQNVLNVTGGENKPSGYRLLGHDRTGKDLLVVPLDDKGNEVDVDLARANNSFSADITTERMGNITAIRIPNVLPALPDVPSEQQQRNVTNIRNFQTLMEGQLRNKGSYYSSDNLKNEDGSTFPYGTINFQTPKGTNIRVKAVRANGQIKLVPSSQTKSGSWDNNHNSFSTPEELVQYFRLF